MVVVVVGQEVNLVQSLVDSQWYQGSSNLFSPFLCVTSWRFLSPQALPFYLHLRTLISSNDPVSAHAPYNFSKCQRLS